MTAVGSNPTDLDDLAHKLQRAAYELENSRKQIGFAHLEAFWEGADSEHFRNTWQSYSSPKIVRASGTLAALATSLHAEADEQRSASDISGEVLGVTFVPISLIGAHLGQTQKDLDDPEGTSVKHGFWIFKWTTPRYPKKTNFRDTPLYDDGIAPADVIQGHIGDCFLPAAVAAIAVSPEGRALLRNMITENTDGTFTVTFGNGEIVNVDGDLYSEGGNAAYGKVEKDKWFAILEKAYAIRNGGYRKLDEGGFSVNVFRDFGYDATSKNPADLSDAQLRSILLESMRNGLPVAAGATVNAAGTGPEDAFRLGRNETGGHAFSVTAVTQNPSGECVITIRNPWAEPADLTASGIQMNSDGTFQVTEAQFRRLFRSIDYATK
jgi:Calpain family cysteine protease